MALNFKELNDKLNDDPLTPEELQYIKNAEEYIDGEIVKQFRCTYGISIDLSIPDFESCPKMKKSLNLKSVRRKKMRQELDLRYNKAGWNIKVSYDDGLDGPNMSGSHSWILTGKE